MKKSILLLSCFVCTFLGLSQDMNFKNYPARSVGPVIQGARIVDIAVSTNNEHKYLIGFASGGVFKTINNGVSFYPIFDEQGSLTIGDIAIAPSDENIIYVGTGENNSSRSSYAGNGIYKSKDGGKSWTNIGLINSQHIGRIVVHPTNPDIVWVASMGGLYSDNAERGIFKSTDGGKNWTKTLFINDKTGAIDLIINPNDPSIMYASMWERKRYAWDFVGNGPNSGIYKSTDGGESWLLAMSGFPQDKYVGRIGLDISLQDPNILYAVMDYQKETKEEVINMKEGLTLAEIGKMTLKDFLAIPNEKLDALLTNSGFPKKYNAVTVKKEIKNGLYDLKDIANYFGDANEALFNTSIAGSIVYKTIDGGKVWKRTHQYDLEGVYYTYGYYFGEIRVSPQDNNDIYVLGVPLIKSRDGGKTFARTDTIGNVHSDHQSMWINPDNANHIILGNDGGLYVSYDAGATWDHKNNMSVGQFYTVNVDMEKPYNIYGGLQDNGTLVGSSRTVPTVRGQWEQIFGGDGMFVSADPRNADIVYVGFQFGNYYRMDRESGRSTYITPSNDIGTDKLRFNWRTPVLKSSHNSDILYIGSQKLHRSLNQGNSWEEMSEDLTNGSKEGNVPYGTITEIAESNFQFGLLYVGTDDGNVWRYTTKNGWSTINNGLPSGLWVSSIHPSVHDEATVYLTLTGYRQDDFTSYVYKSTDFGNNWTAINGNIKDEAVNVIYEDLKVPHLLFLGTDNGSYLSMDGGIDWNRIHTIPNVATYDMVIHPREQELVVGTHGRSVYVIDLEPIQLIAASDSASKLVTLELGNIRYNKDWGKKRYPYMEENIPIITFPVYVKTNSGKLVVQIQNESGKTVKTIEQQIDNSGYQEVKWNGQLSKKANDYISAGKYTVMYKLNGEESSESLEVK